MLIGFFKKWASSRWTEVVFRYSRLWWGRRAWRSPKNACVGGYRLNSSLFIWFREYGKFKVSFHFCVTARRDFFVSTRRFWLILFSSEPQLRCCLAAMLCDDLFLEFVGIYLQNKTDAFNGLKYALQHTKSFLVSIELSIFGIIGTQCSPVTQLQK